MITDEIQTARVRATPQRRSRWSLVIAPWSFRAKRGSVLVIVMVTLLFAVFALVAFMEKASVDLLVEQREALTRRLRMEACSALEVTLGVLVDFSEVTNGLHSTAEGWTDPLAFAGYLPSEGRTVEVAFQDESGKISLPHANAQVLTNLFFNWGILKPDAEALADAMVGWMKHHHVYTSSVQPTYDSAVIPFEAPGRSLKSLHELAAIEKVREMFYDTEGRPNDFWRRFADSVSLLDFPKPNINGARADTLAALGQFDPTQQRDLGDFFRGAGNFQSTGPGFFQSPAEAQRIAGPTGNAGAFASTISALRITVTVRDGRSEFRMSTVVAPPNGATTVQTIATHTQTTAGAAPTAAQQQARPDATQAGNRPGVGLPGAGSQKSTAPRNLKYPFTLLEIRENDEIPPPPPPPPPDSLI
ncbi:MAG: hypothetical protein EXS37_01990 [Opitutus sp.]|nr:hypothetical protein [Opitutus sp.]